MCGISPLEKISTKGDRIGVMVLNAHFLYGPMVLPGGLVPLWCGGGENVAQGVWSQGGCLVPGGSGPREVVPYPHEQTNRCKSITFPQFR